MSGARGWTLGWGVLLCASLGLLAWWSAAGAREAALGAYGAALGVYGVWAWGVVSGREVPLGWAVGVGLAARGLMLLGAPLFSDDIWRYLWDGHVQLQGVNPYLHAPSSEAVAGLRTAWWSLINHKEVPTIYPPAAQGVFALSALVGGGSDAVMRAWMVAGELLGIWGLGRCVPASRRAQVWALALWSPLLVVEFAGSGHLDALALAGLIWALAWGGEGRWGRAGLALGWSVGAKVLGVVALPFLLASAWRGGRAGRWGRVGRLVGGASLVVALTFAPYFTGVIFGEGGTFGQGFSTYARKWRWNDGPYAAVFAGHEALLETASAPGGGEPVWRMDALTGPLGALGVRHVHEGREVVSTTFTRYEVASNLTKGMAALLLALLGWSLLWLRAPPLEATLAWIGVLLLVSPVVHPWYVAWLVPLALARRFWPFVLWGGSVVLSYGLRGDGGAWDVALRVVEYGPVVIWAGVEGVRRMGRGGGGDFDAERAGG